MRNIATVQRFSFYIYPIYKKRTRECLVLCYKNHLYNVLYYYTYVKHAFGPDTWKKAVKMYINIVVSP